MRTTKTLGGILFVAATVVALTGCSGGGTSGPTATRTVTTTTTPAAATPTATTTPTTTPSGTPTPTPTCGPSEAAAAIARPVADLPLPTGLADVEWDAADADVAGYDACAPLSWVTVSVERATGGSPVAILLFHQGRYLGTATKEAYAFVPDIARTDPATIAVTYHYAKPDEPLADASGRTHATYTWSDATGRVEMRGQTPPVG